MEGTMQVTLNRSQARTLQGMLELVAGYTYDGMRFQHEGMSVTSHKDTGRITIQPPAPFGILAINTEAADRLTEALRTVGLSMDRVDSVAAELGDVYVYTRKDGLVYLTFPADADEDPSAGDRC